MKLNTFIKKLQKIQEKQGNIDVSVHDSGPDGDETHSYAVSTICWFDPKKKANKGGKMVKADSVMICSAATALELSQ